MTKVQKLSLDIECVIADLSPKVVSFFQTNFQFASYTTRFWRTVLPFPFPISSHFPRFQGLLPLSPILLLLSFCLHLPVIFCASCIASTTTFLVPIFLSSNASRRRQFSSRRKIRTMPSKIEKIGEFVGRGERNPFTYALNRGTEIIPKRKVERTFENYLRKTK